jgi:hypothetical protein
MQIVSEIKLAEQILVKTTIYERYFGDLDSKNMYKWA